MVPFLSLASDGVEGRIGRHQRRVRHTVAGQNPRWYHATDGTAAQDKAHLMDCSRGTGPRHEELFEPGVGSLHEWVSFVSLARNIDRNTQHGRGKASGAMIRVKLQTPHPTATTRRERWDTVSECVRGEASASETWFQREALPINRLTRRCTRRAAQRVPC